MSEDKQQAFAVFLKQAGWRCEAPVSCDVSPRRYYRVSGKGTQAILMDASAAEDRGEIFDFIRIAGWLNEAGLKAPEIFEAAPEDGFLILEDFGDISFGAALATENPALLYETARSVLAHMARQNVANLGLPDFFDSAIYKKRDQFIKWYAPLVRPGAQNTLDGYRSAWAEIEAALPPCPQGFVHGDYHAENLMRIPGATLPGLKSLGILDFQGALYGPLPYDLGNLLEDARRDISSEIRDAALSGYDEPFLLWYRVLTTQFHCRVAGLFVKLAAEQGRNEYLIHLPRLRRYIAEALDMPVLAPLKYFLEQEGLHTDVPPDLSGLALAAKEA